MSSHTAFLLLSSLLVAGCSANSAATADQSYAVAVAAGRSQAALVSSPVRTPPRLLVTDATGTPVPGMTVVFSVLGGGGTVDGAAVTTDSAGFAAVRGWTLGADPGLNILAGTLPGGVANSAMFYATGMVK